MGKFGKIVKWGEIKYGTRGGFEWEDRRETIYMWGGVESQVRIRKILRMDNGKKTMRKYQENIKKVGIIENVENMKLEKIIKIVSMGKGLAQWACKICPRRYQVENIIHSD